jgi:hypothetical protein
MTQINWLLRERFGIQSLEVRLFLRQTLALVVALAFAFGSMFPMLLPPASAAQPRPAPPRDGDDSGGGCNLKSARGDIKHVIYIQFDNVHFRRDNPNVPSDLEQMPHLLNFLTNNGTLLANHHTPLISHTADDIVTSLTGVYGDRQGIPVANSFGVFNPPGSKFVASFPSSFTYWTDPVNSTFDTTPIMLTADGKNAPAPWVPYTRAGCNVGAVSTANIELENTRGDLLKAFASDPAALATALAEANSPDPLLQDKAFADYAGIAIHCAQGSAVCSKGNGGEPDLLPDEPDGYTGFNALYGHIFVAPVISPGKVLTDLDGNPITDTDTPPHLGFPGFDPTAAQSLAYVADMQEHGVPITFAYIADAHDNHPAQGDNQGPAECLTDPEQGALGPGDQCYVAQLAAYDEAFGKFFDRLAKDGITKANTLFVITSDENDHFAGGPPTPATCDGSAGNFCSYPKLGEIDANVQSLLTGIDSNLGNTPFDIHFDMAPTFYVKGQPGPGDPTAREFEQAAAKLTAVSPITGSVDQLTEFLADPVEMKLLHMVTADPLRTPTFVMFGNPDYFFTTSGPAAPVEDSGFAWNHGGVAPEINTTWLGIAGPGVKVQGVTDDVWSDHTDIRPTILSLVGLKDDYQSQGRVLAEALHHWALPEGVEDSRDEFVELARAYKQVNAPVGELGLASLKVSTKALAGDQDTYTKLEGQLAFITSLRNHLADEMLEKLTAAEFHGERIGESEGRELIAKARALVDYVNWLASH